MLDTQASSCVIVHIPIFASVARGYPQVDTQNSSCRFALPSAPEEQQADPYKFRPNERWLSGTPKSVPYVNTGVKVGWVVAKLSAGVSIEGPVDFPLLVICAEN